MRKWSLSLFIVFACSLYFQPCRAEKAYVTNPTKITLRSGPSIKDKILAMLPQDEPVEILNTQEGWSYVRLLDTSWENKEGWIVSGFLVSRVPWERQAESLKDENARLKEKLNRIEGEWEKLSGEREQMRTKLAGTERAFGETKKKYQTLREEAASFLELKKEHEIALEKMQEALATAEKLTKENNELKSSQRNTWFLTGGAVMLVGLIFGLVLGKREKKRKSMYY